MSQRIYLHVFTCFFRVRLIWNLGDKMNRCLKVKAILVLYDVVILTPKTSTEQLTLTVVEMQRLPDLERIDSAD